MKKAKPEALTNPLGSVPIPTFGDYRVLWRLETNCSHIFPGVKHLDFLSSVRRKAEHIDGCKTMLLGATIMLVITLVAGILHPYVSTSSVSLLPLSAVFGCGSLLLFMIAWSAFRDSRRDDAVIFDFLTALGVVRHLTKLNYGQIHVTPREELKAQIDTRMRHFMECLLEGRKLDPFSKHCEPELQTFHGILLPYELVGGCPQHYAIPATPQTVEQTAGGQATTA